jgi:hypothetical protein
MTDNRNVAAYDGGRQEVATAPSGGGITVEQRLSLLREALTNPDVDPAKAVAMADLMFKLEDRDRQAEFNRDLIKAKAEIAPVFKRGENNHQKTKYARFEDIQRVTDPVLMANNLSLDYLIGNEGNNITVVPVLRHTNGWIQHGHAIKGPPDTGPGRSAIQSVGSSASYLQRYAAKATLNLRFDGEDNDGGTALIGAQLNDRQESLLVGAQQAADDGEYAAWFGRLNQKDKAVVISSGTHARLGGAPALPGAQRQQVRDDPPPQQKVQEPQQERQQADAPREPVLSASGHDINTPAGWAAQYIEDLGAARDVAEVRRLVVKGSKGLKKLMGTDIELFDKCDKAETNALAKFAGEES